MRLMMKIRICLALAIFWCAAAPAVAHGGARNRDLDKAFYKRFPDPPSALESDPATTGMLLLETSAAHSGGWIVSGAILERASDSTLIRASTFHRNLVLFEALDPGRYALRLIKCKIALGKLGVTMPEGSGPFVDIQSGTVRYLGVVRVHVRTTFNSSADLEYVPSKELAAWKTLRQTFGESQWAGLVDQRMASLARPSADVSDPTIAEVLGIPIRQSQKNQLTGLVLAAVLDRYAEVHDIAATTDEIHAFIQATNRRAAENRRRWEAEAKELRAHLEAPDVSEEEKSAITIQLAPLERILKQDAGESGESEPARNENEGEKEDVARSIIESWKVNQALYRQYGGHVIFQQGGPEPLDAYRQLLTEEAKRGTFTIADKALEASFWDSFRNDAGHKFYGDDEAKRAFDEPWWMD